MMPINATEMKMSDWMSFLPMLCMGFKILLVLLWYAQCHLPFQRSIIFCRLNRYLVKISLSVRLSRGLVLSRTDSLSLLRLRALFVICKQHQRHFVRIYVIKLTRRILRRLGRRILRHVPHSCQGADASHRKFSEIVLKRFARSALRIILRYRSVSKSEGHMYHCCCINETVSFSHCVHLKLGHWFHALLKVCFDRDDTVPLINKS